MGQRLNIEIRKDNKVLANAYYHWSGYTSSSLGLTSEILKNIDNVNFDSDIAKAIKLLEFTGAGLTKGEFDFLSEDVKEIEFKKATDRNDGLIAISEKGISETQKWEEARVEIHIDTKMLKLNLYWDAEEDEYINFVKTTTNYFDVSFNDFEKINNEIFNFIENKNYYFEYENKKYGFIE